MHRALRAMTRLPVRTPATPGPVPDRVLPTIVTDLDEDEARRVWGVLCVVLAKIDATRADARRSKRQRHAYSVVVAFAEADLPSGTDDHEDLDGEAAPCPPCAPATGTPTPPNAAAPRSKAAGLACITAWMGARRPPTLAGYLSLGLSPLVSICLTSPGFAASLRSAMKKSTRRFFARSATVFSATSGFSSP